MKLEDVPIIGKPETVEAYNLGHELEKVFPEQDATDLMYACENNGWGPLVGHRIVGLLMIQQGEPDETDWIWLVALDCGSHYWAVGGCDYTGWDCRSSLDWTVI